VVELYVVPVFPFFSLSFFSNNQMKKLPGIVVFSALIILCSHSYAQSGNSREKIKKINTADDIPKGQKLFLDVHHLGPGKVTFDDVAKAHARDLAVQGKYGAHFIKYWFDAANGDIYCLVYSNDSQTMQKAHAEAHGLLADDIYLVTGGPEAVIKGDKNLYMDLHELGAGKVKAENVAAMHQKDLAVQSKYGANFVNYWVSERDGLFICLVEASDTSALLNTHREAHGLMPKYVNQVKQGE
jgi:hypothetical protein